jgi:hypothetical protein
MDASAAAEVALRRTLAGEAIIVPGALNRVLAALSRLVPRTSILAVVSAFWGKTADQRAVAREDASTAVSRSRTALGS